MLSEQGLELRGVSSGSRESGCQECGAARSFLTSDARLLQSCRAYCEWALKQGMIGGSGASPARAYPACCRAEETKGHENKLSGNDRRMRRLGGGRASGWGIPVVGAE